jgi:3-dehydroquinate dehydratase-2
MDIYVINGPNLEMLQYREKNLYGGESLEEIQKYCAEEVPSNTYNFKWLQSSSESKLIEFIHQAVLSNAAGIIINPAAYGHTSVALLDALLCFEGFVIEVHLSNVHKRELFRQTRLTAKRADALIEGLGKESYRLAVNAMIKHLEKKREQ